MNKYVVIALIISALMIGFAYVHKSEAPATGMGNNTISTLSPGEFKSGWEQAKTSGGILIDVRTPQEYKSGHYTGAINIDYYDNNFKNNLSKLDKNKEYYIYCRSGHRSGNSLSIMKDLGFKNVHDLAGGIASSPSLLPIER